MSACVYYRRGRCASPWRCQYKLLSRDGMVKCQRDGELGQVEKSSAGPKAKP